jgi:acyl-CoA thioester hydrolase
MNEPHRTPVDIYYEDTDMGGVVYYANYLKYFERGRTELLKSLGVDPAAWAKVGVTFAVVHAAADYKRPAVYGDRIAVETRVEAQRGTRLAFTYRIVRPADETTLVTGRTDMACLNESMRPRRIPDEILDKITQESL